MKSTLSWKPPAGAAQMISLSQSLTGMDRQQEIKPNTSVEQGFWR